MTNVAISMEAADFMKKGPANLLTAMKRG